MNPYQQSPAQDFPLRPDYTRLNTRSTVIGPYTSTISARSPDAGIIVANWLPTLGLEPNAIAMMATPLNPFTPLSAFLYSGSQSRARVRGAMLGALTPAHREAVGRVLGQSAVSSIRDDAILSKQLDDVLTAHEKRQILESFAEFVSEERSEEREAGVVLPGATRGNTAPRAGAVLWRALLLTPPSSIITIETLKR